MLNDPFSTTMLLDDGRDLSGYSMFFPPVAEDGIVAAASQIGALPDQIGNIKSKALAPLMATLLLLTACNNDGGGGGGGNAPWYSGLGNGEQIGDAIRDNIDKGGEVWKMSPDTVLVGGLAIALIAGLGFLATRGRGLRVR